MATYDVHTSLVVVDVQSGELLALANYRTEDPVRRNAKGASKGPDRKSVV